MKDGTSCHTSDLRNRAFPIPYPVVYGFGAEILLSRRRPYGASFSIKI